MFLGMENSKGNEIHNTWRIESFSKTIDCSLAAQKSVFMLNGAAAIGVLTFLGNCIGKSECQWGAIPLLGYVFGILFNIAGMFLTREAQAAYTDSKNTKGDFLNKAITFFCVISLLFFMSASVFVAYKAFGITKDWSYWLWIIPFIILFLIIICYFLLLSIADKKK